MNFIKNTLPVLIAASSLAACNNSPEKSNTITPEFGTSMEIVGKPHSVKNVQIIHCAKALNYLVNANDTYSGIAESTANSTTREVMDIPALTAVIIGLDKTPGLSAGEELKIVDPRMCYDISVVKLTESVLESLSDEASENATASAMGTRSVAIYGTPGSDQESVRQSRDLVRVAFLTQP